MSSDKAESAEWLLQMIENTDALMSETDEKLADALASTEARYDRDRRLIAAIVKEQRRRVNAE